MQFDYRARDADGRETRGRLDAPDEAAAVRALAEQGLTVVQLQERQETPVAARRRGSISRADQVMLLQELATLLKAGVSLGDTLPSLTQAYASHPLGPALAEMHAHVRGGGRLSTALEMPALKLPGYVHALTQAGEASGQLARALSDAAAQMELDRKSSEALRSALVYPSLLVTVGIAAVFYIFVFVVPKFAPMLRNARAEVPEISRLMIESGVYVKTHLEAVLIAGAAGLALLAALLAQPRVRHWLFQQLSRLPGVGPWLHQMEIGRWATVLGTLLDNRVAIVPAMTLALGALRIDAMRAGLERTARALQQGDALADALSTQTWFPATRINLIRVGERSGELPRMLLALGESQTDSARTTQTRLLGLIEPAAILVIGGVIGFIMTAVMLTVTSLNSSI
ncbi:type II secretion system F family protein [Roseateles sp. DB2]|uniref:type II secretion system F family protein n=1 Tax=Roseateles sp. DB2 TaxID=3453717 RepID=UPI003EEB1B0E